jgi:hypothetical protein
LNDKKIEYEQIVFDLRKRFPDDESCLKFIADFKWRDGFKCRNCGHTNFCRGKTPYSRRCTRCKKDESAIANTIFHRCRIPMTKAFELAFLACSTNNVSSGVISKKLKIRKMTCFNFQKKIKLCMKDRNQVPLLVAILNY